MTKIKQQGNSVTQLKNGVQHLKCYSQQKLIHSIENDNANKPVKIMRVDGNGALGKYGVPGILMAQKVIMRTWCKLNTEYYELVVQL